MAAPAAAPPKDKKVKKGPNFELKAIKPIGEGADLSAIIPPEPTATRSHGFKDLKANLLALQESPNEPYEVAHYAARPGSDENPSGAKAITLRLLKSPGEEGRIAVPNVPEELAGQAYYDIEWRSADYDGSDREGTVIIAMYVLPADADAAAK